MLLARVSFCFDVDPYRKPSNIILTPIPVGKVVSSGRDPDPDLTFPVLLALGVRAIAIASRWEYSVLAFSLLVTDYLCTLLSLSLSLSLSNCHPVGLYVCVCTHITVHRSGDPSAQKKFVELTSAYEVLKDPTKRREYDMFGGGMGGGMGGFGERPRNPFEQQQYARRARSRDDFGDFDHMNFDRFASGDEFARW
jgi:DnaJ domain